MVNSIPPSEVHRRMVDKHFETFGKKKFRKELRAELLKMNRELDRRAKGVAVSKALTEASQAEAARKELIEIDRHETAEAKWKMHRQKWLVKRYREGAKNNAELAKGYHISPGGAYALVSRAAIHNPSIIAEHKQAKALKRQQAHPQKIAPTATLTRISQARPQVKQASSFVEEHQAIAAEQLGKSNSSKGVFAPLQPRLAGYVRKKTRAPSKPMSYAIAKWGFMKDEGINSTTYQKLETAFVKYFGDKKFPDPGVVVDRFKHLQGEEAINLPSAKIYRFATMASFGNFKQLRK